MRLQSLALALCLASCAPSDLPKEQAEREMRDAVIEAQTPVGGRAVSSSSVPAGYEAKVPEYVWVEDLDGNSCSFERGGRVVAAGKRIGERTVVNYAPPYHRYVWGAPCDGRKQYLLDTRDLLSYNARFSNLKHHVDDMIRKADRVLGGETPQKVHWGEIELRVGDQMSLDHDAPVNCLDHAKRSKKRSVDPYDGYLGHVMPARTTFTFKGFIADRILAEYPASNGSPGCLFFLFMQNPETHRELRERFLYRAD